MSLSAMGKPILLPWLQRIFRPAPEVVEPAPEIEARFVERLDRIRAHEAELAAIPPPEPPPAPASPLLLLPPPNYRREFIGRR